MQFGRLCRLVAGYIAIVAVLGSVVGGFRLHAERWQQPSLDSLAAATLCLALAGEADADPADPADHDQHKALQACAACALPAMLSPQAPALAVTRVAFVPVQHAPPRSADAPNTSQLATPLGSRAPPIG